MRASNFSPRNLLGRHVAGGAHRHSCASECQSSRSRFQWLVLRLGDFVFLVGFEELHQSEIEDLAYALIGNEDVRRLDVAMDDALLVRGLQPVANLNPDVQQFVERKRSLACGVRQAVPQSLPFQQLHNHEGPSLMFAEFVDRADVGMIK